VTSAAAQWRKEIRELLPIWGVTIAIMLVCWLLRRPDSIPIDALYLWVVSQDTESIFFVAVCFYSAGAVILGALSIGQEYSYGTLPQLLTHPGLRTRVLGTKLAVLSMLLASLTALAFFAWRDEALLGFATEFEKLAALAIPVAAGFFLAPWMTMVGRSPLGGALLASIVPAAFWILGTAFQLPARLWWAGAVAIALFGALMTWRTFTRLEVGTDHQREIDVFVPFARRGTSPQPQNAFTAQLKKELRLQQLTLIAAGLYIGVWLIGAAASLVAPLAFHQVAFDQLRGFPLGPLFAAIVPMMAGAVAIAEERRLRVHQWHNLLPMSAWRQWLIKAGVALTLAMVLGFVLASILDQRSYRPPLGPLTTAFLCAAALYMSSISSSTLRAMLATVPVIALAMFAAIALVEVADLSGPLRWLAELVRATLDYGTYSKWKDSWPNVPIAGTGVVLLAFAYSNQRRSDPDSPTIRRQFGWLLLCGLACVLSLMLNAYLSISFRISPDWPPPAVSTLQGEPGGR
jgi:hypothetical protein